MAAITQVGGMTPVNETNTRRLMTMTDLIEAVGAYLALNIAVGMALTMCSVAHGKLTEVQLTEMATASEKMSSLNKLKDAAIAIGIVISVFSGLGVAGSAATGIVQQVSSQAMSNIFNSICQTVLKAGTAVMTGFNAGVDVEVSQLKMQTEQRQQVRSTSLTASEDASSSQVEGADTPAAVTQHIRSALRLDGEMRVAR